MAKQDAKNVVDTAIDLADTALEIAAVVSPQAKIIKVALEEFCALLSATDKRVELIGGFYHWMKHAEKTPKATEAEYRDAFKKFCTMPA